MIISTAVSFFDCSESLSVDMPSNSSDTPNVALISGFLRRRKKFRLANRDVGDGDELPSNSSLVLSSMLIYVQSFFYPFPPPFTPTACCATLCAFPALHQHCYVRQHLAIRVHHLLCGAQVHRSQEKA